ncbi:hypothetical protein BDP55DRAFT_108968 [Colletotrichum godetiae]|uniref:Uncharacterized protein n=1 Tax=Colletotrichum godetiae TaxID=1209918 RepID=A0AAJ0AMK9_9PEZI|nr:uncharacterized protein BDP55DRAFT_108968 [Colletotrichum godetiae]KAK1676665.1 hypothetical protein BDP55DRAFT_108968 [Colletotrichum godetiae]
MEFARSVLLLRPCRLCVWKSWKSPALQCLRISSECIYRQRHDCCWKLSNPTEVLRIGGETMMQTMEIRRVEFLCTETLPRSLIAPEGVCCPKPSGQDLMSLASCRDETEFAIVKQLGQPAMVASHLEPEGVRSERSREKGAGLWPSLQAQVAYIPCTVFFIFRISLHPKSGRMWLFVRIKIEYDPGVRHPFATMYPYWLYSVAS